MNTLFNFATGEVINPLEGVKKIVIAQGADNSSIEIFKKHLNKSKTVSSERINKEWRIVFNTSRLNFPVHVQMFDTERGKFKFNKRVNKNYSHQVSIHFIIENDIMHCW